MFLSSQLKQQVFDRLKGNHLFIVGSFSLAILEDKYFNKNTISFGDIDLLTTELPIKQQKEDNKFMQLYNYFKDNYSVSLSFNYYSPQLKRCEELVQEASLFNINRFLIDIDREEIIYDKSLFSHPKEIVQAYYDNNITINPDCCTYYYKNFEENCKQLEKRGFFEKEGFCIDDIGLEKELQFVTDEQYIEDFYNSNKRYTHKPKEGTVFKEKPEDKYFIKYYDIRQKFEKEVTKL